MKVSWRFTLEKVLRKELEAECPKHPALFIIYHSTHKAIDEYHKALHGHPYWNSSYNWGNDPDMVLKERKCSSQFLKR